MRPSLGVSALGLGLLGLTISTVSDAQSTDPAARGLDAFIHAPTAAAPGAMLPLSVEVFGFQTVASPAPIAGATVEAMWNPETLGEHVTSAPPAVAATCDANGRAHLDVPVPPGAPAKLELLVGLRSGAHARTRTITVQRDKADDVSIQVADTHVVPGSTISAWVFARSASTGEPVAGATIEVSLAEGGVARHSERLTTDTAGSAMTRVSIPPIDEPAWQWTLEARALDGKDGSSSGALVRLAPREETPGLPELTAKFSEASVLAGDPAKYIVRLRDGSDQPIAGLSLRTWTGPRGTRAPEEPEKWLAASQPATTNAAGEVEAAVDTPRTVTRLGTSMHLVARATVDGHELKSESDVLVGAASAKAEVLPELGKVVPGLEQKLLIRLVDAHDKPIQAPLRVEGDGLGFDVRTDASGEAEVSWTPPADFGALRNVGPCAGGVAASVRVRATSDVPALATHKEPFELCVPVDRDTSARIMLDRTSARAGDRVHVSIVQRASKGKAPPNGPWSVVVRAGTGDAAVSRWINDGDAGADIDLPKGEPGVWTITALEPHERTKARVASLNVLVAPRVLPKLAARISGGRSTPGGSIEIDADLADEKGKPLAGTIAGVMIDARGGGSIEDLVAMDTRRSLCAPFDYEGRCDRIAEGDPALDATRRAGLGRMDATPIEPLLDPGADVDQALERAFGEVVRSLEGAVLESTSAPERLRDVGRKENGKWTMNPEIMTLATAAMDPPPTTPGGEPLTLADLVAIDPQVTFDRVARRVTRLKLFRVLQAVRQFRKDHAHDDAEPMLKDPNAILRRLVREEILTPSALVDPWGGTIEFVKGGGQGLPFLTAIRGFDLRAPGPDGKLGTGDDVRDPFERVLASKTPYAKAVSEDRLVDAKLEMEVGDATVAAWDDVLTSLTGISLGNIGTLGHGSGTGTGQGFGSGHGRLGGSHRTSFAIDTGAAWWSAPVRTDAKGHVHMTIALPDVETTWRIGLVGIPDAGTPATAALETTSALPLSARVEAGASWIEGDEAAVKIALRNRTSKALRTTLSIAASDAAELAKGANDKPVIDVAAGGTAETTIRVRAPRPGLAKLDVKVSAPGIEDSVSHSWRVREPGELTDFTSARWIAEEAHLALTMPGDAIRVTGSARVVLERGYETALRGALMAVDPDHLSTPAAMADAIEVAGRVRRWAIAKGGDKDPLAERALDVGTRAAGRLFQYKIAGDEGFALTSRAWSWTADEAAKKLERPAACPPSGGDTDDVIALAEAEPDPQGGSALACWDALVSNATDAVGTRGTVVDLARLLLAEVDRSYRTNLAGSLAERLRERVQLSATGAIVLPPELASSRSARATVFAALLASAKIGNGSAATADRLAAWALVQRDADGSFGSSLATRSVVHALLAATPPSTSIAKVTVTGSDGAAHEVDVGPSARVVVPLAASVTSVDVKVAGPSLIARFERPVVRLWSRPLDEGTTPLRIDATWPADAKAGGGGLLHLSARGSVRRDRSIEIRVPLPPGVTLAERVNGARVVQGVLAVRRVMQGGDAPTVIDLPLRFALSGRFTAPEIHARVVAEEGPRASAPARSIVVR